MLLLNAETKIDSTVSSTLLSQQGCRIVRKERKKGAGGLKAYIKVGLSVHRMSKLEPTDIGSICLDVQDNKWRFIVCACYRSPGKCKEQDFLASLSTAAEAMYNLRREPPFLGDFNMDLHNNIAEGRAPYSHLVDFFASVFAS